MNNSEWVLFTNQLKLKYVGVTGMDVLNEFKTRVLSVHPDVSFFEATIHREDKRYLSIYFQVDGHIFDKEIPLPLHRAIRKA